jgi:hypothetical protein
VCSLSTVSLLTEICSSITGRFVSVATALYLIILHTIRRWVAQSVQCLTTDWTTGFRSQTEAKDFSSSLCVQTSPEAHRASYPMGNGCPLPTLKRGRGVTLTTHSHLLLRSRMSRSYTSLPLGACMTVEGHLYRQYFMIHSFSCMYSSGT